MSPSLLPFVFFLTCDSQGESFWCSATDISITWTVSCSLTFVSNCLPVSASFLPTDQWHWSRLSELRKSPHLYLRCFIGWKEITFSLGTLLRLFTNTCTTSSETSPPCPRARMCMQSCETHPRLEASFNPFSPSLWVVPLLFSCNVKIYWYEL